MTGQSEWGGEGRRRAVRHADGHPGGALAGAGGVDAAEAAADPGAPSAGVDLDGALAALAAAVEQVGRVDRDALAGRVDAGLAVALLAQAVEVAAAVDTVGLSDRGLCGHAVAVDCQATRLQAEVARVVADVGRREAYRADGFVSSGSWWRTATRRDPGPASTFTRTAARLAWFPDLADAFAAGQVGYDHAAAVCRAAIPQRRDAIVAAEDTLLGLARRQPPTAVRTVCRAIADAVDDDGVDGHTCHRPDGSAGGPDARRELFVSQTIDDLCAPPPSTATTPWTRCSKPPRSIPTCRRSTAPDRTCWP